MMGRESIETGHLLNGFFYNLYNKNVILTCCVADLSISTGKTVKAADGHALLAGSSGAQRAAFTTHRSWWLENGESKFIIIAM